MPGSAIKIPEHRSSSHIDLHEERLQQAMPKYPNRLCWRSSLTFPSCKTSIKPGITALGSLAHLSDIAFDRFLEKKFAIIIKETIPATQLPWLTEICRHQYSVHVLASTCTKPCPLSKMSCSILVNSASTSTPRNPPLSQQIFFLSLTVSRMIYIPDLCLLQRRHYLQVQQEDPSPCYPVHRAYPVQNHDKLAVFVRLDYFFCGSEPVRLRPASEVPPNFDTVRSDFSKLIGLLASCWMLLIS